MTLPHTPRTLFAALLLSALLPAHAAEPDVTRLLADADRIRVSDEQLVVETRVNTFKSDGTPDKERLYTVHTSTGRRSLVLMRSPAEQGQKVRMVGEERCDTTPCWHLSLAAQRPGVSYQRIELWLGRDRHQPLKADLYLQSDKLAKQARFLPDSAERPTQIDEMVLQDQLSHHRETRVRYTARAKKVVPESWFNPMSLARNPTLE